MQKIYKNIQTDVIYLDFAKAFDSVDYSVLLQKLKPYGVEGGMLAWFTVPKWKIWKGHFG